MSILHTRRLVIAAWATVVAVYAGVLATLGVSLTGATGALLAAAVVIPALVLPRLWRDTPPQTAAQVLGPPDDQDARPSIMTRGGRS